MHKYAIAHSFLMITSVLASDAFYARQATTTASTTPATTSPQTTAAQPSASSAPPTTSSDTAKQSSSPSSALPSTAAATTASTSAAPATSAAGTTSTSTSTSASTSAAGSSSPPPLSSSQSVRETLSASTSTDAQGSPVTVTFTNTVSVASSSDTPSSAASPPDSSSSSSSHAGTIIGLSVAGGVAALAIVAFIIWKLTRKRFSDLDDPDEAIKWPELNREHTDVGNGLSPQVSNAYSSNAPSRNHSTFDPSDPYAVPPLPQFNPNQPYRDDPYASSGPGYYDPYRGPVPQTFHDGSVDGHENIPMGTYPSQAGSGTRNPAPGMGYDMGGRGSPAPGRASPALGRASPALGPVYDSGARASPTPGRTISPGPAAALGLDRRPAYDVQNNLPGQQDMAVGNKSPGPYVLA